MDFNKKTLKNVFLGVVVCILLYWFLHDSTRVKNLLSAVYSIVSPFMIGAGIAFVLNVPMRWFENRMGRISSGKLRRTCSVALTILAFLLVMAGVFWLLIPQISDTFSTLVPKLSEFFASLGAMFTEYLNDHPKIMDMILTNAEIENLDWASIVQSVAKFVSGSVTTILTGAISAIGSVASGIVNGVIALVFAVYCLFQKETLARQGRKLLYAFLPEKTADQIIRIFRLTSTTFSNFLSGQCIEVVILGSMFAIAMAIFRMPYIPLVSVLVAVTAFIPVVGAWVGCVLGAFFILVSDPMQAVWFVLMFLILQQIENHLIYPRVVGTSIGLSGMWVLVAVSVGGALFGVAGMFVMIPLASVAYTVLSEITHNRLAKRKIDQDKLQPQPPETKPKKTVKKKKEAPAKKQEENPE